MQPHAAVGVLRAGRILAATADGGDRVDLCSARNSTLLKLPALRIFASVLSVNVSITLGSGVSSPGQVKIELEMKRRFVDDTADGAKQAGRV